MEPLDTPLVYPLLGVSIARILCGVWEEGAAWGFESALKPRYLEGQRDLVSKYTYNPCEPFRNLEYPYC